ncbi:MAG: thioredoxin family protein [Kiloniellales bacterium]
MLSRRGFTLSAVASGALAASGALGRTARATHIEPEMGDDGLHKQPWFLESFLELYEDLSEAAANNKHLAVMWEQKGCPYCRETHRVNLARHEISDYIKANFEVLQLNLWGSRKVTDFDGKVMEERDIARRWNVVFTPTISFFPNDPNLVEGKTGGDAEIMRMPGYFKPYHFLSMFEYVRMAKYKELSFQKYIQIKFEELKKQGKKPTIW